MRIELEGKQVAAEELWPVVASFGHFTAMQVRAGRTRGLDLHLDRLEAANRELFEARLDRDRVRMLVRHTLADVEDASVRIYIHEADPEPAVVVTVKEPGGVVTPQRLLAVRYQRPDAHLKHLATEQSFYSRLARRKGFDDALLTADSGTISETTIANIGFIDSDGVVWPDAPLLEGITMQLLERSLPAHDIRTRRAPIRLQDAGSFDGAFLANARGIAAISAIDEVILQASTHTQTIIDIYASLPWVAI